MPNPQQTQSTLLSPKPEPKNNPKPTLGPGDAVAIIIGIVIGAGIFRSPSLVASSVDSESLMLTAWFLGGLVSFIGALCYAELIAAFPNAGGDYYFLLKAFGKRLAFLFAWARMSVVQTGSIALLAYIFGDYMAQIIDLGSQSSVLFAALIVIILTTINILGLKMGTGTQKLLTILEVLGVLLVIIVGFFFVPAAPETTAVATNGGEGLGALGLAMVFVLLTFGGWNEAAYISAEIKSGKGLMVKALILSIVTITVVYFLANMAYLRGLGLEGMAASSAVAGDLLELAFGEVGLLIMAVIVVIAALTSANATIFTGARSNYALGRDFPVFSVLGKWNKRTGGPVNAFIVQGVISLVLVSLGLFSRSGFETMVEYTAPVFWFFFLLVGISLFILRIKEPNVPRPFKVPLYPLTPIIFCSTSAYLLYSSIAYTGWGALVGVGVLLAGVLLQFVLQMKGISRNRAE
ncbi:MAG TPA: amino acid permease [Cyclobacteriaceae bacterium]|nr:amino acid permease [Cyclobacteriaceae bacterium]